MVMTIRKGVETMRKIDMLKELDKGKVSIYDFVCRHSHEMSREELADIVREMDYAMYTLDRYYSGLVSYDEFHTEFLQNLYDRWEDDIKEEIEEEENGGAE